MQPTNLNDLAKIAYEMAVSKGFYEDEPRFGERIALIHSEVSEMLEADRQDKWHRDNSDVALLLDIQDDAFFQGAYKRDIKGTVEEELADTMIRLFDLAGRYGVDLQSHTFAKMRFNSLRPHKHGKKY